MKAFLLYGLTLVVAMVLFRSTRFDFFDLNSDKFDISWDDITEDLGS